MRAPNVQSCSALLGEALKTLTSELLDAELVAFGIEHDDIGFMRVSDGCSQLLKPFDFTLHGFANDIEMDTISRRFGVGCALQKRASWAGWIASITISESFAI